MSRDARILGFLVLTLAALCGCSSAPNANEAKKGAPPLDKIQGKAQVLEESAAADAALNAGGPSLYLWEGTRRYRLFLKTPVTVVHGNEYIAEGIYAQKAIDDIGDPDQGKNGYPLKSSCERVVRTAWSNLSFDGLDATTSLLWARVKRYPARPVFLVAKIRPVEGAAPKKEEQKDVAEINVAADKAKASLIEGPTVLTAPLWEPKGGTARCKVVIDTDGKIVDLETGAQLCETVPWSQFRYKPTLKAGKPVKVDTEVEVTFEPRVKPSA